MNNSDIKRSVIFISVLTSFITPFMGSAINIALPSMGKELNMDAVSLSWVATSYLLTLGMFLLPMGKWADIKGRKKVYTWGIFIYSLSSLLLGFCRFSGELILLRVIQGIGSSMIYSTGIAILTSVIPGKERGKALGINVASTYTGLSLGPVLGGILTHQWGWRSIFLSQVPMGIIIIILIILKIPGEWAESKEEKMDIPGSVLYCLSITALMYSFSRLPDPPGWYLIGGGVAVFSGFVIWENQRQNPLVDINFLLSNRAFLFSNLSAMINYSATFGVGFLLSLYLQYIKDLTPDKAGMIMIIQPLVMAIFSPIAGYLSDHIEPRIVASLGMGFTALGLFLFTHLEEGTSSSFIVFTLIMLGFGFGIFSSPNTNAIMSSVEKKYYGVASAMVGTMRSLGQMFSMGITGLIFALYMGKVQLTPLYYNDFLISVRTCFIIFAVLCVMGIFASLSRGTVRENPSG